MSKKNEDAPLRSFILNERARKGKTAITISTHCFLFVGTSFVHLTIKANVGLVKNMCLFLGRLNLGAFGSVQKKETHRNILLRLFYYAIAHPAYTK